MAHNEIVSSISIKHKQFYLVLVICCSQLNSLSHCYQILTILFKLIVVCTQLNGFKYCYLTITIQFNTIDLFADILMVKQFYLNYYWELWVDLGVMSIKRYSTFHKAPELKPHQMQFSVISKTHIGCESITPPQRCS